jgi:hypothetical protein
VVHRVQLPSPQGRRPSQGNRIKKGAFGKLGKAIETLLVSKSVKKSGIFTYSLDR